MDYWCDIVKNYDVKRSNDQGKKDHGTYSQSAAVILLIYLSFGEDHPYNITSFFKKGYTKKDGKDFSSSYLNTQKVGTLLNKMREDELLLIHEDKIGGRLTKTYSLNPRIIQSPIRGGAYPRSDGTNFEIPLDKVVQLLAQMDEEDNGINIPFNRTEIFKILKNSEDKIDYCAFIGTLLLRAFHKKNDLTYELLMDYAKGTCLGTSE
jgi:hypothetical protein